MRSIATSIGRNFSVGTEEETEKGLAAALEMEVEVDRGSEGEEGGGGTQRAL